MIQLPKTIFIDYAKERCLSKNRNLICVFLGATGSGKSYAALNYGQRIADACGTPFSIENNVAFTFEGMLRKSMLPGNDKPGTVFVLEELGALGSGGSSHSWQSKANAFFSSFLQTARHRNQILLFTTPNWSLIMKQARMLIHMQVEMLHINHQNNTSQGKVYLSQTNPRSGKVYFKFLRVVINKQKIKVSHMTFNKPEPELLNKYETEKLKFTSNLNKFILESSEKAKKKSNGKIEIDEKKLIEYKEKDLTINEMAKNFDCSRSTIKRWLTQLRNQGKIS